MKDDLVHWHILGAGAIGSLYAYFLQGRCTLLVKEANKGGNQKISGEQNTHWQEITIEREGLIQDFTVPYLQSNTREPIQNLLVCTKAHQTQAAIENLNLKDHSTIVLLQNGMGNAERLAQQYPTSTIFCASTTHGAYRKKPCHIVHAGLGSTYLGTHQVSASQLTPEKLAALEAHANKTAKALSSEGENLLFDPNMKTRLWLKLAINCVINPLTAIYRCQNGDLLSNKHYYEHLHKLCAEIDPMFHALKIIEPADSIFSTVSEVAQSTAQNYSSMYQDLVHQRLSEIEFIQGYLCRSAEQLGLELKENKHLLNTIREIEAKY